MSFSVADTRRRLPWLYLGLLPAGLLAWALPHHRLWVTFDTAMLWPLLLPTAHVLCGFSYTVTSLSTKRGLALLRSSLGVYGQFGSLSHLQAALLVATIEEILFRYAMLHELVRVGMAPWIALLATSVLFSAAHLRLGLRWSRVMHYLDYLIFGVLLAGVTLATRSIIPAIVLHTGRNYILRCLLVSKQEYQAINRR